MDGGGVDAAVMITENGNSGVSIMCVCARAHAAHSQSGYFLCSRELCIQPTNGGGVDSLSLWETWIITVSIATSLFRVDGNTNVALLLCRCRRLLW